MYSCDVIMNQFITSVTQISCPNFIEDDCEPGTTAFSHNGCCKVCTKKMTSCKLTESYDYLSYNNCRTADLVKMPRCDGLCGTSSIYSSEAKSMSHKCACCREVQTSQKHAVLQCTDGSQVEHEYTVVEKCDCMTTECELVKLNEEVTSPPRSSMERLS
ncbi:intestinal mucin-like protein [Eleutherodactylus coqui]|uniref:intestinal mucin-like protein n=1 Tax=Eleutherodactylus coqui TaxID=57060 RepID=UPI003461F99D